MARYFNFVFLITVSLATKSVSPISVTFGAAPEPWLPLNGGSFSGLPQPFSPDPLVQYQWPDNGSINDEELQLFSVSPLDCGPHDTSSKNAFQNVTSCDGTSTSTAITVTGQGTLIIDFGVELAAFLEIDISNLCDEDYNTIQFGIGEYTEIDWVGGFKRDTPKRYGSSCGTSTCTYRLETSNTPTEMYEGIRYGFLVISSPPTSPFILSSIRAVSQAKAVNYTGSFSSAGDPLLERVWYTAAYTVRATLQSLYMGSILMNRGDRFSWQGDAHPTQATSMIAFSNYAFVFNNMNRSKSDCQGIATYCLYFILSVGDYFRETGDVAGVAYLTPNIQANLDHAVTMWPDPEGLRFVGWDDRTGSGFANNTTPETQNLYRLLAIRAFACAGDFFTKSGNAALGTLYSSYAANFTNLIRTMNGNPWYSSFGLHAGADAVNAGFLTQDEMNGIANGPISDIVILPSQSNFNQYFILQALSGLGQLDRGVESIRIIWGAIVTAGATTFWETSHPSWVDLFPSGPAPPAAEQSGWVSYCHPWSSGPTPWLSKWILGIRPLEPGYTRTLIAPHIAHTMKGVSGSVGTPHGSIILDITRAVNNLSIARLYIILPSGINEAVVRLSSILLQRILGVNSLNEKDLSTLVIDGDYNPSIVHSSEAPLLDESNPVLGRAASLEFILKGGMEHTLLISTQVIGTAPSWKPLESPFPPPTWPGQFIGSDYNTQGNWVNKYGADGYVLFGYDVQSIASDPFCGLSDENTDMTLQCLDPGATIQKILFASFGAGVKGQCGSFTLGSCNSNNSLSVVSNDCLGKNSCTISPTNDHFGGDPCPGTSKQLWVTAHCSTGNGTQPGSSIPPTDRVKIPNYVTYARAVNYDGYCGANFNWNSSTTDQRALQDPSNPSGFRKIGLTQPCGCPTSPVDILLTDQAKASGKRYKLSLYFVDWAPSPSCQAYDGTQRSQEVYLLTGYPNLNPFTPRQALTDFTGGIWMSYDLVGDARVRISTIKGDFAVLSALAFDSFE